MNRYALLVGVNEYADRRIPPLQFAEHDARELARVLKRRYGFVTRCLTGKKARRGEVLARLSNGVLGPGLPHMGKDDQFLFFFAGHGELVGGSYVLHLLSAAPQSMHNSLAIRDLSFHLREKVPCARCMCVLDACRNLARPGARGTPVLDEASWRDVRAMWRDSREKFIEILFGCSEGEQSLEDENLGHGILTYHLKQILTEHDASAGRTFQTLACRAGDRMRGWLGAHRPDISQEPRLDHPTTERQIFLRDPPPPPEEPTPVRSRRIGAMAFGIAVPLLALLLLGSYFLMRPKGSRSDRGGGARDPQQSLRAEAAVPSDSTVEDQPGDVASIAPTPIAGSSDHGQKKESVEPKTGKQPQDGRPSAPAAPATPPVEPERHARVKVYTQWPFNAAEAKRRQRETARALGVPVEKDFELARGMRITMALIPPGKFLMGSPENEEHRDHDEDPQHEVTISKPFYMGVHEVTQAQYAAVMGSNPSRFQGDSNPVEAVLWNDAQEFCRKLSKKEGVEYRLPTEAEWEYACRAGTTMPFHFGETISTDQANCDGTNSYGSGRKGKYREKMTPVGSFAPNAWGLHDMHGNVCEWCQDNWHAGYKNAPTDGRAWEGWDAARVLRGGSWRSHPWYCRSANRRRGQPGIRSSNVGFRIVVDLDL